MGVIVGRAGVHDHPEVLRRGGIASRVELGTGKGLPGATGTGLSSAGTLEDLGGGGRAAPAQKFHAALVPGVRVFLRGEPALRPPAALRRGLARDFFVTSGIPARA